MNTNTQLKNNTGFMSEEDQYEEVPEVEQSKKTTSTTGQIKKTASYTYWVDENNKSRELPPEQRPQKIDPPKPVTQKPQNGPSHWNTAGTWEHKKVSLKEIQQQYTQNVNQWLKDNAPQTQVKKISLNGECQLVFIRTKKALTYEINGKVELQKCEKKVQLETKKQEGIEEENKSDSLSLSDDNKSDNSENSPKQKPQSKSKKSQTMTFEIVDLTDHGDREYKSKADQTQDKKWIKEKSQELLKILENILKSYK